MPIWHNNREKQALFDEVAMAHLPGLYYAALRLSGNPQDAEDLLQETFARAYGAFESFTLGTNARAWLYRIMNNTFINYVRSAESRSTRPLSATSPDQLASSWNSAVPDPADIVLGWSLDSRLSAALAALPVEMRSALVMVDAGGFSYEEAAAILGCPIGTVRSRLYRARSILRVQLTEDFTEDVPEDAADSVTIDPLEGQHG